MLGKDRYKPAGKAASQFVRIPDRYGRRQSPACTSRCAADQECQFDLTP